VDLSAPQVLSLRNDSGTFATHVSATGDEQLTVDLPFSIAFPPADLVR
jgi:hypothetical protein